MRFQFWSFSTRLCFLVFTLAFMANGFAQDVYLNIPPISPQKHPSDGKGDSWSCGHRTGCGVLQYYGLPITLENVFEVCPKSVEESLPFRGPAPFQLVQCMNRLVSETLSLSDFSENYDAAFGDRVPSLPPFDLRTESSVEQLLEQLASGDPVMVLLKGAHFGKPRLNSFLLWSYARLNGYPSFVELLRDTEFFQESDLKKLKTKELRTTLNVPSFHYVLLNGYTYLYPAKKEGLVFFFVEPLDGQVYRISADRFLKKWDWQPETGVLGTILDHMGVRPRLMIKIRPFKLKSKL